MDVLKDKIPNYIYQRLLAVNIESLDYFLLESQQEISEKTKLSNRDINHLIEIVSELTLNKTFISADLIKEYATISLGCPKLNNKIKGIPKNGITEIYGESGTGKTQLMLQLLTNVDASIYICTEDAFPSKRLNDLLPTVKKQKMDNIFVEHIHELDRLKYCIDIKIPVLLSRRVKIQLIVIDSIASIFRYDDNEYVDYIQRTEDLHHIAMKLNAISREYDIAIVCTNQVSADPNLGLKPCLGLSWSNLIRKRIQLTRTNASVVVNGDRYILRKMKVIFCGDVGRTEVSYVILTEGVKGL